MSGLSVGIVGLPNVGKSTLFNALMGRQVADTAPYPFCTVEPNVGIVGVPDARLKGLVKLIGPEEEVPAVIEFVDIAGLVKGAHRGEGLGNQFLARIREVDVILHLIRAFKEAEVARAGSVTPQRDLETVNLELVLKDLETVEKMVDDRRLEVDSPEKYQLFLRLQGYLEGGQLLSGLGLEPEERVVLREFGFLTLKPQLLVANVDERVLLQLSGDSLALEEVLEFDLGSGQSPVAIPVCARLEEELAELVPEDRVEYFKEVGVSDSALDRVIKACYKRLGLVTFYTVRGGRTVQAWPVREGATVLEAADLVHSDFKQRFIRAEVVTVDGLTKAASWPAAKEQGLVSTRGRDYVVVDGDVIEFKI